jgi:dolichol-phosphate mannosyltransferase
VGSEGGIDGAQTPIVRIGRVVRWAIPAYNEEASIADMISRMAEVSIEAGWTYEIWVIDDGSKDATGDIARSKAAEYPVIVRRNEPNAGLGRTIRRGLREASEAAGPDDVIITLDADLTQDPGYAPVMLARIDEGDADVVIASRYRKGAAVEGLSWFRTMLSFGAGALVLLVRPIDGVRDYSCGFRMYRAQIIKDAFARDGDDFVSEQGFACMVEIAERLRGYANFAEIPFVLHYDAKRKESAIKIGPTIRAYFRVIAKVAATRRKPVPWLTLVAALASVVLGAFAQRALQAGVAGLGVDSALSTLVSALAQPAVAAGLGLYLVASVLWLGVLSRMELAVAYPLGGFGYALGVVLAAAAGTAVSPARWLGVVLITLGALLVAYLGVSPKKGTLL